jgi:hypothetical protein
MIINTPLRFSPSFCARLEKFLMSSIGGNEESHQVNEMDSRHLTIGIELG